MLRFVIVVLTVSVVLTITLLTAMSVFGYQGSLGDLQFATILLGIATLAILVWFIRGKT